jgi:hypothetical protein
MLLKQRWFCRYAVGGESRGIWKLGPICIKRWSPRISPAEVRRRCRISRENPVCNRLLYVPWFHWTVSLWRRGEPATHDACNALLARYPVLADLHPANIVMTRHGPVVIDFTLAPRANRPVECHAQSAAVC